VCQRITPHNEVGFVGACTPLVTYQVDSINRIVWAWSVDINCGNVKRGVVSDGQANHAQPLRDWQFDVSLLMGGITGWREKHSIQTEGNPCFLSRQQMPEVDGIEGAAEDSKLQVSDSLLC
jgi:hypothetical protein